MFLTLRVRQILVPSTVVTIPVKPSTIESLRQSSKIAWRMSYVESVKIDSETEKPRSISSGASTLSWFRKSTTVWLDCGSMAGMDIQTIFTTPKEDTTWYLTDVLAAIGRVILEFLW
jgi:hypothetical protein